MHEIKNSQIDRRKERERTPELILEAVLELDSEEELIYFSNDFKEATIDQIFQLITCYNSFSYNRNLELFLFHVIKNSHHLMFKDYICIEELISNAPLVQKYCLNMASDMLEIRSGISNQIKHSIKF